MHIVYICSPDRKLELTTSIGSLFASGTEFRKITVYIVGPPRGPLQFDDPRIRVEPVPDISAHMWMENKTHLSRVDSDRVLFIDTDTVVLKPLQHLFDGAARDVVGRITTAAQQPGWRSSAWNAVLLRYGAGAFFPYLNTGLLYFPTGAHRRLAPLWLEITRDLLTWGANPFGNPGQSNQHAFSLACGALGFTFQLLSPREHAYGWMGDDYRDAHVYHTGKRFIERVLTANSHADVLGGNPLVNKYQLIGHLHLRRLLNRWPFTPLRNLLTP